MFKQNRVGTPWFVPDGNQNELTWTSNFNSATEFTNNSPELIAVNSNAPSRLGHVSVIGDGTGATIAARSKCSIVHVGRFENLNARSYGVEVCGSIALECNRNVIVNPLFGTIENAVAADFQTRNDNQYTHIGEPSLRRDTDGVHVHNFKEECLYYLEDRDDQAPQFVYGFMIINTTTVAVDCELLRFSARFRTLEDQPSNYYFDPIS